MFDVLQGSFLLTNENTLFAEIIDFYIFAGIIRPRSSTDRIAVS